MTHGAQSGHVDAIEQTPTRMEQGEVQGDVQTQAAPEVDPNSGVYPSLRHGGYNNLT
jgi:hypothetical protein